MKMVHGSDFEEKYVIVDYLRACIVSVEYSLIEETYIKNNNYYI